MHFFNFDFFKPWLYTWPYITENVKSMETTTKHKKTKYKMFRKNVKLAKLTVLTSATNFCHICKGTKPPEG